MIEFVLVFFTICTLSFYYLSFRRSRKRLYELADKIPGPFDWPIIGSVAVGLGMGSAEIFDYMRQFLHTIPTPVRAWIGPHLIVFFDKPEHLAVILNSQSCVRKSYVYKFFRFEKGLLNTNPDLWRLLRKRLNPSFSSTVIKTFVPAFNEQADKLVTNLEQCVDQEAFDILPKTSGYALSATLVNLLGVDLHSDDNDYKERFAENAERMWLLIWKRLYQPWLYPEFIYRLTPSFRMEEKRIHKLQELSHEIFTARESARLNVPSTASDTKTHRPEVLIERLERLAFQSKEIDQDTFMRNIDTFLYASNDTTSNVTAHIILMLAMHPDIQERVYHEAAEVISGDTIEIEDLSKLVYLEMVIKETLRLIPVGAMIGRVCDKELQVDEWTIPAGTEINIIIFKLHRDKAIWGERSEEFDPDNFLPERCAQRHPYAYLPFSGGIRNCIGMKYAWISLKIVIAKLVRKYSFSTDLKLIDLKFQASLVVLLANKHMVRVRRRQ